MNTVFETARRSDCYDVALAMREADKAEIYGVRPDLDPHTLAVETAGAGAVVAKRNNIPIAIIAGRAIAPAWIEMWAYATDDWPQVVLSAIRYVRRYLIPSYLQAGINRGECRALASNHGTGRWLRATGAVPEAVLEDCGPSRLTFVLYAWRRKDFQVSLDLPTPDRTVREHVSKLVVDAQDRYG